MRKIIVGLAALAFVLGMAPSGSAAKGGFPIVYMSVHEDVGNGDIHLLRNGHDGTMDAANSNGHDCGPALKPTGDFLAFESNRAGRHGGQSDVLPGFDVYALNLRTDKVQRLTTNGGAYPTWSPDGARIAYSGPGGLWVMNADGSAQQQLTSGPGDLYPSWSPDGTRIAFTSADLVPGTVANASPPAIYVIDPDGRNLQKLTDNGEYPSWSPDGTRIVFDRARGKNSFDSDLYVMRADGTRVRSLGHQRGSQFMPSWSPDGRNIAYVQTTGYWTGIVAVTILPVIGGEDLFANGPTNVWELTLRKDGSVSGRKQLSSGSTDLFPRYSPVRNPM